MDILQLYKEILTSLHMSSDDQGLISLDMAGEKFPAYCNKKRLVLPTQEVLRQAQWENSVAFHPLSENILRGESAVLKKLRSMISFRISEVTSCLMTELVGIAADNEYHKKLTPTQSEFLSLVPQVDHKTCEAFEKVFDATSTDGEHRLVSVYLKRGGTWKGEKYSRVAVVAFPITDEFGNDQAEVFGVKMRKKDKKVMEDLFEFIIPHSKGLEEYSFGSNSMTAPYMHAMLMAYVKVAKQLNKIVHKYRKHLDNPDQLHIDLAFEDKLGNLGVYKDLIPTLAGNDGEAVQGTEQEEVVQKAAGKANVGVQTHMSQMAKRLVEENKAPDPAPVAAPQHQPAAAPQQSPFNSHYQPPQPQHQPAPKANSGRGLSWDQVVANNPVFGGHRHTPMGYGQGAQPHPNAMPQAGFYPQQPLNQFYPQQPATTRGGYAVQNVHQNPNHMPMGYQNPGVMYPGGI